VYQRGTPKSPRSPENVRPQNLKIEAAMSGAPNVFLFPVLGKGLQKARSKKSYTGWGKKMYDYLKCCKIKTKRTITLKQVYWYSVISNLNFDICLAHFDAILAKIYMHLSRSKHFWN
jgi:hypothetical protein